MDKFDKKDYLDIRELSYLLNKSQAKIFALVRNNEFESAFKAGGKDKWYVETNEIIEYVKNKYWKNKSDIKISEILNLNTYSHEIDKVRSDEYISVMETRNILHICRNTIYRRIARGLLKAKKSADGNYLISKNSVLKMKNEYRPYDKETKKKKYILDEILEHYEEEINRQTNLINTFQNSLKK
jgi:predicted DNA-binding transcriptional regulator AlpA